MLKNIRFIANSTMLAAAALVVGGVIQLTDEQSERSRPPSASST